MWYSFYSLCTAASTLYPWVLPPIQFYSSYGSKVLAENGSGFSAHFEKCSIPSLPFWLCSGKGSFNGFIGWAGRLQDSPTVLNDGKMSLYQWKKCVQSTKNVLPIIFAEVTGVQASYEAWFHASGMGNRLAASGI